MKQKPGAVAHTYNPSTQKVKAEYQELKITVKKQQQKQLHGWGSAQHEEG